MLDFNTMDPRDAADLYDSRRIVREHAPGATAIRVQTSDQEVGVGFVIYDVQDATGAWLADTDANLIEKIEQETFQHMSSIAWRSIPTDKHGDATIELDGWPALPEATAEATPAYVLVVRDPDAETQITTHGPVTVVSIDLGSTFDGEPEEEGWAIEWVTSALQSLDPVPVDSEVFRAATETLASAVDSYPAADALIDQYIENRKR